MNNISKKEKKLLLGLISEASNIMGNSSCNDISDRLLKDFTHEELCELDKQIHIANGDPEEHEDGKYFLFDFCTLDYLAEKYLGETIE